MNTRYNPPAVVRTITLLRLLVLLPSAAGAQDRGDPAGKPPAKDDPAAAEKRVRVDREQRRVTVEAVACEPDVYPQLKGAIEYILVSKGGKAYESLFETEATPEEIRRAFSALRLPPGRPAEEELLPAGVPFRIAVEHAKEDGSTERRTVDEFVLHAERAQALTPGVWTFTGSTPGVDPESGKALLQCHSTKNIVGLHFMDASPLLQNTRKEAMTENIYKANKPILLAKGTPVRLVFEEVLPENPPPGVKRVHVYVSGRVQGVGYRAFTQRAARRLELTGVVRNLEDGRVEAAVEGVVEKIDELLQQLQRGPRSAAVEKVDAVEIPARGDWKTFEILR